MFADSHRVNPRVARCGNPMRTFIVLIVAVVLLVGCVHQPPTPDLPRGPVIEYGKPGVVR